MRRFFLMCAALFVGGAVAFGQDFLIENRTVVVTGAVDIAGDVYVGNYTPSNVLQIVSGGSLTNINGYIGGTDLSFNNLAIVTGTNAVWINTGDLVVGNGGSTNNLTIEAGGRVENVSGLIGFSTNANNNAVLVDGAGSVWNNSSDLAVGVGGSGNSLTISDGGVVSNVNGFVGYLSGASNNTVSVSGAGSRWDNNGNLILGNAGASNNSITVENDGTISAAGLTVYANNNFNLNTNGNLEIGGAFDAGQSGFNWNDGGALFIGGDLAGITELDGTNKTLTLNGGTWDNGTNNLVIGLTGLGNSVTVSNNGVVSAETLTVTAGNDFDLNQDGTLKVTDLDAGQGGFNWNNGGHLFIGGDLAGIDGIYGTNQLLTIDGGTWTTNSALTIGLDGSGNSLTIQEGGVVVNTDAFLGTNAGADSNSVLVTGGGSTWTNTGTLNIGATDNSGNAVTVKSSGTVVADSLTIAANNQFNLEREGALKITGILDGNQTGDFNWEAGGQMEVSGTLINLLKISGVDKKLTILDGGTWDAPGEDLVWGALISTNNTLTVKGGGQIESASGIIGGESQYSTGNKVEVEGAGSQWIMSDVLRVGADGTGNGLSVATSGTVSSVGGSIGESTTADKNYVSVSGTNAVWVNTGDLTIGEDGNDNYLQVGANGAVFNNNAAVGSTLNARGNYATINGENARWINAGTLTIGHSANFGNYVTVANGGYVEALALALNGEQNLFNLNQGGTLRVNGAFAVDTYAGLNWTAGGNLSVGGTLSGITNLAGGRILTLNGPGALWESAAFTNMMVSGEGELQVTNSAIVKAGNLDVLNDNSLVNVGGNAWLLVGDGAATNTLANGGAMVASTDGALLSVDDFASVNIAETLKVGASATITGTVSVANGGTITAGNLVIEDANSAFNLESGGKLAMTDAFDATPGVGFNWKDGGHLSVGGALSGMSGVFDGTNKELTIDDGGSWSEGSGGLIVGAFGVSNTLNIVGTVANGNGYVGSSSNAWDNIVMVSGSNSVWNNTGTLQIGAVETNGASLNGGNSVSVADNGTVIADALTIYTNNHFNLNDGGTLRMTGDFDISDYINANFTTLNWASGGNLYIEGDLTGMATTNLVVEGRTNSYTYLDGGHVVTIDGTWSGDTNLIIGFNSFNNGLIITNGGTVDNANGYIGWGSGARDNSVLVSGAGSTWTNRENLYVGGYAGSNSWYNAGARNSLTVESDAWVFVGDAGAELSSTYGGGIGVASTNGAELVVGNGSITAEQGLHIGVDVDKTGSVTILDNGIAILSELNIATNSEFNLYGTLKMTGDLDVSKYIGSSYTNLNWNDGGDLVILGSDLSGISSLSGSNKTVTIEGGSWLNTTLLSIDGFSDKLVVSSNSLVTSDGASIGTTTSDFGNSVTLSGSNSVWRNSGDLYVGDAGSGNSLTISAGSFVTNLNAYIGSAATASNNTVMISGPNSVWGINGNLYIGRDGSNSTLTVADHGTVFVGTDLFVQNGSTLDMVSTNISVGGDITIADSKILGSGVITFNDDDNTLYMSGTNSSIADAVKIDGHGGDNGIEITDSIFTVNGSLSNRFVNFDSLLLEDSTLSGSGSLDGIPSITLDGGVLAPTGAFKIDGEFVAFNQPLLKLTAAQGSLGLTNTNLFDLSTMGAEVTINNSATPATFNEVILTADGGLTNSFAAANFIEHFLLYDFLLTNDLTTVSVVSEAALDGEIGSTLAYGGIQGVRASFNGMQNALFVRTKQLRRNAVATDHAISNEAYLMSDTNAPAGPMGPGDKNTIFGMHFWAEQFSGKGDYDTIGISEGFILNNNGTTFGFDRLFGDSLVAGINYTYARSAARATGGDQVDTETYWLGLYGEWFGKSDYYLEGLIGLGWSDYSTVRTDVGYEGVGTFEGSDVGGHIEAGKYLHRNNWAMAPYAGLSYLGIESDPYTETEMSGDNEIRVNGESVASLESALGVKLRNRFDTRAGRFQTVGYAEWAYDFINDDIGSTLSDGTISVETARIAPGAGLFNAGIGLSWICTDYLEVGVGYDGRFNEDYEEHTGSIMLDIRF